MADSQAQKVEEVPSRSSNTQPDGKQDKEGGGYLTQLQLQCVVKVIEGVKHAQTKGAYNLDEAEALIQAIKILTVKKQE